MLPKREEVSFFKDEGEFASCVFVNSERTSLSTVWLMAGGGAGLWEKDQEAAELAEEKYSRFGADRANFWIQGAAVHESN